jgi:anthranilate phosphoribosyltransferase
MSRTKWFSVAPTKATNNMANTKLYEYLVRLINGEDLSLSDSIKFFNALTEQSADATQIAGALTALTAKGETPEELAGMTRSIREKALKIDTRHKNFINIAETGTNFGKTFKVSVGAALITAGAGLPIVKQSNRRTTKNNINSNVLSNLGVKASETQMNAEACLNGAGICYIYAPKFYPELQRAGEIRRKLGIHSCLKLLGALSNPAGAPRQLIGVWHPSLIEPMAQALALLGTRRAWVVHGSDGRDELTLSGETLVGEVIGSKVRKFKISPEEFGLRKSKLDKLKAETAEESAGIIKDVLSGKRRDEARSLLVLNSAAAILIGGLAGKPIQAARIAEQSIYSNSAQVKLERLIQTTNHNQSVFVGQ